MKTVLILAVAHATIFVSQYAAAVSLSYTLITSGLDAVTFETGLTELESGDVDGDGRIDLVTIGDHGSPRVNATEAGIMVWKSNGLGTDWSLVKTGDFGYGGVALGDVNNDGITDIGYAMHHNYGTGDFGNQLIEVALGDGSGASWMPYDDALAANHETYGMFGIDFADVDHDGLLDLAANSFGCCNGFHVYRNVGDGTWTQTFAKTGGNSNQWCKFGDFNNDGHSDLIVALDGSQLWSGAGDGTFTSMANGLVFGFNIDVDVADVNSDGACDIAVAKNGASVYFFDVTTTTWQSISSGLPTSGVQGIRLADMDMDGNPEVIIWSARVISIYKSDEQFQWSQIGSFPIAETSLSGLTIADFDHDGFNDIAYLGSTNSGDNMLRVYLRVPDNPQLGLIPILPKGGEHLIAGSAGFLQWLGSVPAGSSATVSIDFSSTGRNGPWSHIASRAPDSNRYQWTVPQVNSSDCYLRYRIKTGTASKTIKTRRPFTVTALP
jgi:hypothetical protein